MSFVYMQHANYALRSLEQSGVYLSLSHILWKFRKRSETLTGKEADGIEIFSH